MNEAFIPIKYAPHRNLFFFSFYIFILFYQSPAPGTWDGFKVLVEQRIFFPSFLFPLPRGNFAEGGLALYPASMTREGACTPP